MSMGGFNLKQPEWSPSTVTFRWSDNPQKITMFLLYNVSCNNCNWDTFSSGPTSPSDPFAIYADPLDALERATDTRIYNSPDLGNFESAEVMVDMRKKTKKVRVARWPKRNNLKQPFRAPKESYFYRFWHLASLITKVVSLKRFVNVSEKAVQVEEMPRTESEKILYKCRKLSVGVGGGRQFDAARAAESDAAAAAESQRSSVFVQIKEELGEESEESRQKAARRENRLVGDDDLAEISTYTLYLNYNYICTVVLY